MDFSIRDAYLAAVLVPGPFEACPDTTALGKTRLDWFLGHRSFWADPGVCFPGVGNGPLHGVQRLADLPDGSHTHGPSRLDDPWRTNDQDALDQSGDFTGRSLASITFRFE